MMYNQEKYLKYKNKYLNSKQTGGGSQDSYYIYFCFNKELTSVSLKSLKDYKTYDMNDIDCKLNLNAYKNNFNNQIDLVKTPNSEKKLIDSFKIPKVLFIDQPLDKIKCTSKINLIKIIKGLENKVNNRETPAVEAKPTTDTPPAEAKPAEAKPAEPTPTEGITNVIHISNVLLYNYNHNQMELISHYEVENDDIKEIDIGDNFSLKFIEGKTKTSNRSGFSFR